MATSTPALQVQDMNARLQAARTAYYNGSPIMSDAEYDALEAQLAAFVKAHPETAPAATALATVGAAPLPATGRVKHQRPMLSIENQYDENDISSFYQSVPSGYAALEPKRDGISCELRYTEGQLKLAVTRGTGTEGEDMTAQVLACKAIPKTISLPGHVNIRGELVMTTDELARINALAEQNGEKQYMSPRNLTAGTMKQKDLNVVASRNILFIPWDMYSDEITSESGVERLKMLEKEGFPKYDGVLVMRDADVIPTLHTILEKNKQSNINADGVVIKADRDPDRRKMGNGTKFALYQTCFKPQNASAETTVKRIIWQVGRKGKITPVAECEPVILAGAQVTRASVNNLTWLNELGLKTNATVRILRSGDIIPIITEVIDASLGTAIAVPTVCPACSTPLHEEVDGRSGIVTHWCTNSICVDRVTALFTYVADRSMLEIEGLGPEMAFRLHQNNHARTIGELFTWGNEAKKLMDEGRLDKAMAKYGYSAAAVRKMVATMETAKTAEWDRWIAALDITGIARSNGKVLAKALQLTSEDMAKLPEKLRQVANMDIEGFGYVRKEEVVAWANDPASAALCHLLAFAGVKPKSLVSTAPVGAQPLAGIVFCITGEFVEERESLYKKLESLGAVGKTGVSSKCNLLIVGEGAGSSKLKKAASLNIRTEGKDWLLKTLADNGVPMAGGGAAAFDVEEL